MFTRGIRESGVTHGEGDQHFSKRRCLLSPVRVLISPGTIPWTI